MTFADVFFVLVITNDIVTMEEKDDMESNLNLSETSSAYLTDNAAANL